MVSLFQNFFLMFVVRIHGDELPPRFETKECPYTLHKGAQIQAYIFTLKKDEEK